MSVSACVVFVSCFSYHHGYPTIFLCEISCIPGKEGVWNERERESVCVCLKMCPLLITVIPEIFNEILDNI